MILVVFGTTGELIKLAPVLVRLERRNIPYVLGTTGQQVEQIPAFLAQFGIRQPDVWLARGVDGHDLRVNADVPGWLATVGRSFAARRSWLRNSLSVGPGQPLVLVHGDTMTTVLGAVMGRRAPSRGRAYRGRPQKFQPAPPLSGGAQSPAARPLSRTPLRARGVGGSNLRRGTVVDTGANTIRDSLELVPEGDPPIDLPDGPFGSSHSTGSSFSTTLDVDGDTRDPFGLGSPYAAALRRPLGHRSGARALPPRRIVRRRRVSCVYHAFRSSTSFVSCAGAHSSSRTAAVARKSASTSTAPVSSIVCAPSGARASERTRCCQECVSTCSRGSSAMRLGPQTIGPARSLSIGRDRRRSRTAWLCMTGRLGRGSSRERRHECGVQRQDTARSGRRVVRISRPRSVPM